VPARAGRPAKPVDTAVADAVIEQIARGGRDTLRVEGIAATVGVHRSTIYRRWPPPAALIDLAVRRVAERLAADAPAAGSSPAQLLDAACDLLSTGPGWALTIARAATFSHPVPAAGTSTREESTAVPALHDLIVGAAIHRILIVGAAPDDPLAQSDTGCAGPERHFGHRPVTRSRKRLCGRFVGGQSTRLERRPARVPIAPATSPGSAEQRGPGPR
jgi:AcrR family transcriptional regulator